MDEALNKVALEHASSGHWRAHIRRLRALASGEDRGGYRNSTGRLDYRSWPELLALAERGRRPPDERKGAHRQRLTPADEGARHVHDYLAGCRKHARSLGAVELAPRVHELVCAGEGYLVDVSGLIADRPFPIDHRASGMAAHVHRRTSFGSGTAANRMLNVRHQPRPVPDETFALLVRPGDDRDAGH